MHPCSIPDIKSTETSLSEHTKKQVMKPKHKKVNVNETSFSIRKRVLVTKPSFSETKKELVVETP